MVNFANGVLKQDIMTTAITNPQTMNLSAADAIWALIQTQTKSVQKDIAKRFAALAKEERERRKMKAYEATLSPEQKAWAQDVADSISRALEEVKEAEASGIELQSAEDFLKELRAEEQLEETCI